MPSKAPIHTKVPGSSGAKAKSEGGADGEGGFMAGRREEEQKACITPNYGLKREKSSRFGGFQARWPALLQKVARRQRAEGFWSLLSDVLGRGDPRDSPADRSFRGPAPLSCGDKAHAKRPRFREPTPYRDLSQGGYDQNVPSVKILYGTETDTAMDLAETLGEALDELGVENEVVDMQDARAESLVEESQVLVVTSTYGNGDPPFNARVFLEELRGEDMPRLEKLNYAVLALGDSTYPRFCQCGKDFDQRLEDLGARRILERHECDGDPEEVFEEWKEKICAALSSATGQEPGVAVATATA